MSINTNFDCNDYESRDLKPYKGYGIEKCWWIDSYGIRHGEPFYLVYEGDDYIGREYETLKEAKQFIDWLEA